MIILIALILLGLIGGSSYFIGNRTYSKLKKDENKYALTWGITVSLLSFIILSVGIFLLIVYNIRIER